MPHNLSTLMRAPATELFELYSRLDAPSMTEMSGEFSATLLNQSHPLIYKLGMLSLYNPFYPGHWLAKGFAPVSETEGHGYNLFRFRNRMVRRWPMLTVIAPSRFDNKPAYQLIYPACHSICGKINMIDEIRRIDEGLYLGFGTCGFSRTQRRQRLPFALQGSVGEFRGFTGKTRVNANPLDILAAA